VHKSLEVKEYLVKDKAGSNLVADALGFTRYEQALVLPK